MAKSLYDLSGRVAIITGGGTGIGKAIALELAQAGADIILASRNPAHLKGPAQQIRDMGRKCLEVMADVRQPEQVDQMVKKTLDGMSRIDILVNNAGGAFRSPAEKISPNGWNTILAVNLTGTFLCCRAVFPAMAQQKEGVIVNVASISGRDGAPGKAHYGAAKAGVMNLTLSLASEWAKYGIRVNCLIPGPIETEGVKEALKVEEVQDLANVALGRWGQPEEVSRVVLYLVSKAAAFITGDLLNVDGGPRQRGG